MSVEHVRSIVRRASREETLNILVLGVTHERYESTLAKTNHNFYVYQPHGWKEWDKSYSDIPSNYHIIKYIPDDVDYDLILCHVSDQRLAMGKSLSKVFNIPLIRHTHTVPTSDIEIQDHQKFAKYADLNTFISEFSMSAWGYKEDNAKVVKHGIDTDFWTCGSETEKEKRALSVVNLWSERDWACGWNIWNKEIRPKIPTTVAGSNPGLSSPKNPAQLKELYYKHLIFVNTSLNSPIPMSVLEAMSCGCCVVSLPTCMIPGIITNGKNGILCETGPEIVEACNFLFEKPEVAISLGIEASNTIKKEYNIDQFVNTWNNIFTEVIYK